MARLVDLAQQSIAEVLKTGDFAIDATTGNGHDTLFLADQVGVKGMVYGFDIQTDALSNTKSLLCTRKLQHRVRLFQIGHENLCHCIPTRHRNKIRAVMFNLGYLPGGDKRLTTITRSSLAAVRSAVKIIAVGGRVSILAYPGHRGGREETEAIKTFVQSLPAEFSSTIHVPTTESDAPPELIVTTKILENRSALG